MKLLFDIQPLLALDSGGLPRLVTNGAVIGVVTKQNPGLVYLTYLKSTLLVIHHPALD